jgi:hypothetical protein
MTRYEFNYLHYRATVTFKVDPEKFTAEKAKETLEFFAWTNQPDPNGDLVDEFMKKLAIECFIAGCERGWNERGVMSQFENREGWPRIDGSEGITILYLENIEFLDEDIEMEKEENFKWREV